MRWSAGFVLAACGVLSSVGLAASSAAAAPDKTLRWGAAAELRTLDPHAIAAHGDLGVLGNVYEGLVRHAPDLSLQPALAAAWSNPAPDRWRFVLRHGVRFHDGATFDADDVVFSLARAMAPGAGTARRLLGVAEVLRIADDVIELVTERPDPTLLDDIAEVYMVDQGWGEAHLPPLPAGPSGVAITAANGTGPFRVAERRPDERTVLVANADWWGEASHNLARVEFLPNPNAELRVNDLLRGELDLIQDVPPDSLAPIREMPGRQLLQIPALQTFYLGMDLWRDDPPGVSADGRNPFQDLRVRQAIQRALDVRTLGAIAYAGAVRPAGLILGPGIQGWRAELDQPPPADPEAARTLLAAAGFPDGFTTALDCPVDLYPEAARLCAAIAEQLAAVGIVVELRPTRLRDLAPRLTRMRSAFYLLAVDPPAAEPTRTLIALLGTRPQVNDGRKALPGQGWHNFGSYSNPQIDAMLRAAAVDLSPLSRQRALGEVLRLHADDLGHIPLFQPLLSWAVRAGVTAIQRADDVLDLRFVRVE